MTNTYNIYTDGGSVNNEHSACAFIITDGENKILHMNSVYMAGNTNNIAEYSAVIYSLIAAYAGGIKENITVHSDSQLIINQLNGSYQVKAPHLIPLHQTASHLAEKFSSITFTWVPREHPMITQCDRMCDQIIEQYKSVK